MRWYLHKYSGDYRSDVGIWCRVELFDEEPAMRAFRWMGFVGAI